MNFFFQNKIVQLIDANIILRTCMIIKYQWCTTDVGFCIEKMFQRFERNILEQI